MYQFLNCLPIEPANLISRIKLIKKKSRKRNSSKCSSKINLKLSPNKSSKDSSFSKQYSEIPIDQNDNKEVKLISYSNLDISLNDKLRSSTLNNQLDIGIEMREEEFNRLTSKTLEIIKEEDNLQINQLIIEKEQLMIKIKSLNSNLNDEDLNDKILHELHVNSLQKLDNQQCTSNYHNNQSCTLATKHNDLIDDEEIDTQPNDPINIVNDKNEQMDICAPIEINELIELDKLEVKLIDDTNTVDEVETLTTINKIKQLTTSNEQLNQTINNQINSTTLIRQQSQQQTNQNDSIQASKQFNQDQSNINQLEIDEKRKINKKLNQPETDLRTNAILNGKETWIELNKGSNCAIGIDLIERTINDETLFIIHEICEKGIAETDQRLKVGDLILMVNDIQLKNINCEQALDHLNRTSGSVKLLIYRELICVSSINEQNENNQNQLNNSSSSNNKLSNNLKINYSLKSTMQENECNDNIERKIINDKLYEIIQVDLQKKTNKGLGLCIVSDNGKSPGSYISEILPNSIAFMDGKLKKGDHIIYINGEDVTNQSITTTIAMLKCLQGLIKIKVARLMPGQIVSLESFNRNQPAIEPIQIKFRVLVLKPIIKNEHLITQAMKSKQLINDRVRELQNRTIKDTDSIASELSILNETNICNDNQDTSISTINKNWIKVDKQKADLYDDLLLNQQLELMNCQCIHELIKSNRILEIDGQQFNNENKDELLNKLKRSTNNIQMIILE